MATFTIFDDIKRIVRTSNLDSEGVTNIFGDIKLDLTKAPLTTGDHTLRITTVFGDVKIRIPESVGVDIDAMTVFSEVEVENRVNGEEEKPGSSWTSDGFERAPIRVHIKIQNIFGDVDIVRIGVDTPSNSHQIEERYIYETVDYKESPIMNSRERLPGYDGETRKL